MRMRQDVLSSGSYISANDRRLHFGLGDATDAGTAEIHWPSGKVETETAGGGPHLHHHRRSGITGAHVRRQRLCRYACRRSRRRSERPFDQATDLGCRILFAVHFGRKAETTEAARLTSCGQAASPCSSHHSRPSCWRKHLRQPRTAQRRIHVLSRSSPAAWAASLRREHSLRSTTQQKRPITAGGFVDNGTVVFEDATKARAWPRGSTSWAPRQKKYILETDGSGVGLIDYDNDGWLDIYLVNGSTYDALSGKKTPPHAALFHNNHDGTFTDVAAKAGVTNDRWGFGVAIGDYDNDGWPDIFVCNFGKNRLYHNNHDGTFTDVAEKAGVTLGNWSDGATWGDYDGDGRLDLFVSGYVHYDLNHQPVADDGRWPLPTASCAACR